MWPIADAEFAVEVLVHDDRAAGQCAAPTHALDLQVQILKTDRVVAVHGAFRLHREDTLQIAASAAAEGMTTLRRRDLKTAVERSDVVFPQKRVGGFRAAYAMQAQLLR